MLNTIAVGAPHREIAPIRLPDSSIGILIWAKNPLEMDADLDLLQERILEKLETYVRPALEQITDITKPTRLRREPFIDTPEAHGFAVNLTINAKIKLPKGNLINEILYLLDISGILDDFATDLHLDQDEDFADIDEEMLAEPGSLVLA